MKIAFIGGGSVQWTPGLVNDLALTASLHGAQLALHDIDPEALLRMIPICKRITASHDCGIEVSGTLDRSEALHEADFVVLCVGIGGLQAMRADLEIPKRHGIRQSVGDTVGPGGLARGLRHIPFAVQVARAMEALCPRAWLINLTNPMTTLCRAITKATSIRTIGLCHEITHVRALLASLFSTAPESVQVEAGGINHLPVITGCQIDGQDGFERLRAWIEKHGAFGLMQQHSLTMPEAVAVFEDHAALKFDLFERLGVLFGAGDRHIIEFFEGLLIEETGYGQKYGISLTTVEHRLELEHLRRATLPFFMPPQRKSSEQMADVIGALAGGPAGTFIVNIPNHGQIANLPSQVVVECMAEVSESGVHPRSIGGLPEPAQAIIAGHAERQEAIVEAALTGNMASARAALTSDPLMRAPSRAGELLDELVSANESALQAMEKRVAALRRKGRLHRKLRRVNAAPPVALPAPESDRFALDGTPLGQLLAHDEARAVMEKHLPGIATHPQVHLAANMTLKQIAPFARQILTKEKLNAIQADLERLSPKKEG